MTGLQTRVAWALLAVVAGAQAGEVYRCESAAGLAFQDSPCPPRQRQTRLQMPNEPASSRNVPSASAKVDNPVAADTTQVVAARPPQRRMPSPKLTLCRAGDGSRYVSASGQGRVNWVPYTVANDYNRSLAEVYGGRDGLATHAPGAANIPHRPAAEVPGAGYYVQVADPCHQASPAEACGFLREQLKGVDVRLRQDHKDGNAQSERAGLLDQLRGCD